MIRRILTANQKIAIILEGIKDENSIPEICRNNGIKVSQYYKWYKLFLEGAEKGLEIINLDKAEIEKLKLTILRQELVIDSLKKLYKSMES